MRHLPVALAALSALLVAAPPAGAADPLARCYYVTARVPAVLGHNDVWIVVCPNKV